MRRFVAVRMVTKGRSACDGSLLLLFPPFLFVFLIHFSDSFSACDGKVVVCFIFRILVISLLIYKSAARTHRNRNGPVRMVTKGRAVRTHRNTFARC